MDTLGTVGKQVTRLKPKVWDLRNDTDLFTQERKEKVEGKKPQVDHILEVKARN
jgi:hypothetical protein